MKISKRIQNLEPSVTLAATAKVRELKAQGHNVIGLTVGEPDFTTPDNIEQAAIEAIKSGAVSFYTAAGGIPELKEAIIQVTKRDYEIDVKPNQVIVTSGAKFALYALFQTILDKGDEVIIPTPYWVSYGEQVKLAEGVPVFVETVLETDYKVTVEQLNAALTDKTQALMLNSPSNPTGMIYNEKELRAIGEWAVENDVLIISDDIYARLVYNGKHAPYMAAISDEIARQTIIINGVSKTFAMTGWRIGYAIGNAEIIKGMTDIVSQSTSNPTAVSQVASVEALLGDQSTVREMRIAFEERLNTIYPKVAALPGVTLKKPQGAFYLFPNVKGAMEMGGYDNVTTWVNDLLEQEHVALVTGEGFGAPENVRMSYSSSMEDLEEAVVRIRRFIENSQK
ncbi:pyridoxal phosphate-dependent aminotransferase [Enterococcus sp. 669A]|uniref:Aminotransferase n=1 Tax=Candidatus Enterococcus moelleringii TaxID=2815325 RepID=A0ABS3L672_9ENTE|nr:pyridoxal phosphate-dependent aminotransferase [Enterococcus sp. 669A]MBO1305102.1 pyridoxal phosphate-dependent aminotransferase [Enterococcus sp. 669A]